MNLTVCGVKVSVTLLTVLFWLSPGFPNECFGDMSWAPSVPMPPSHTLLVTHAHRQAIFYFLRPGVSLSLKPCHCILCTSQSDSSSQKRSVPIPRPGSPTFSSVEWSLKTWVQLLTLSWARDVALIISFQVPHLCWPNRMVVRTVCGRVRIPWKLVKHDRDWVFIFKKRCRWGQY